MLKKTVESVYQKRREKLFALDPDACFLFFAATEVTRNDDVTYPFRQDSNFYYLTEFEEPGAILCLAGGKSFLFVQDRDEKHEIWDGERYGVERAKTVFQVDETFSVTQFPNQFDEILSRSKHLYYSLGKNSSRDQKILEWVGKSTRHQGRGSFGNLPILDPKAILAELRMVKDTHELSLIRRAASATAKAHLQVLKRAKAGMTEFDAQNEFQYHVFKYGCTDLGYSPIFASGYNATTLHYIKNNETLKLGDLLLIDAAGEVDSYTADLTQTFPIAEKFSPEQQRVYEKVLEVNREITRMIKPGVNYRALHTRSVEMITDGLLSLGVLEGDLEANIKSNAYRPYYPHGLGHYLGLDVHDAGIYHERGRDFELKTGMIITNEPGIYFRERGSPYSGIGVRIEDDILVTETGSENLTHELPRDVSAIENLRSMVN